VRRPRVKTIRKSPPLDGTSSPRPLADAPPPARLAGPASTPRVRFRSAPPTPSATTSAAPSRSRAAAAKRRDSLPQAARRARVPGGGTRGSRAFRLSGETACRRQPEGRGCREAAPEAILVALSLANRHRAALHVDILDPQPSAGGRREIDCRKAARRARRARGRERVNRTSSERRKPAPYCSRAAKPYRPCPPSGLRWRPHLRSSSSTFSKTRCVSCVESTTGTLVPLRRSFTAKTGSSIPHTCLKKKASALSACFWVEKRRRLVGVLDGAKRSPAGVSRRAEPANQ